MKIICDGADLSDAVLKVSKGTSNKTTNPILEGIKVVAEEENITNAESIKMHCARVKNSSPCSKQS